MRETTEPTNATTFAAYRDEQKQAKPKGTVQTVEVWTRRRDADESASCWRRSPKGWVVRTIERAIKADSCWIPVYVVVVRERLK